MKCSNLLALALVFLFALDSLAAGRSQVVCEGRGYEGGAAQLRFELSEIGNQLSISSDDLSGSLSSPRRQFIPLQRFRVGGISQTFHIYAQVLDTLTSISGSFLEVVKSRSGLRANWHVLFIEAPNALFFGIWSALFQ